MRGEEPEGIEPGERWRKILERIPPPEGGHVYVVGGWVRDRILAGSAGDEGVAQGGNLEREIDLVCDRGFFPWVEAVARALPGTLRVERDFLTARIECFDGAESLRVDLAGFRREIYEKDGRLPRVFPGSFDEDAARRDFPMNALYLRWNPARRSFDRLLDPFGGASDLKQRTISLLRPNAFREDPTRIFRWARLSTRLGLSSRAPLLKALKEDLSLPDLWREVGPARVGAEFSRLLSEPDPLAALESLFSSGAVSSLTERGLVTLSPGRKMRLERWNAVRGVLREAARKESSLADTDREMFFLGLFFGLQKERFERSVQALGVGSRLVDRLSETLFSPASWPGGGGYPGLRRRSGGDPGRMLALADRMETGKVLLSHLRCRGEERALWEDYLVRGRFAPPLVGGEVLLRYPGISPKERKGVLEEIRWEQRTGALTSFSDAVIWLDQRFSG
ncbi:MAG: hypothetical protein ACP5OS_00160 [Leptospirillia bacterium]